MRVCGIMSGTSLDGIDTAIVEITGAGWRKRVTTIAHATHAYPTNVREALLKVSNAQTHTADLSRLNVLLGELYADAVQKLCKKSGIVTASLELIGCHGQTIFHESQPTTYLGRRLASTLQLGDAATLAERTGVNVVSNFRARDMAAGGTGAPLVPYVDYLLFRHAKRNRIALNIGGIANLSSIPPNATPERVIAFDTGPGNMLIDQLVQQHTGNQQQFDKAGRLAAQGTINPNLLRDLLKDPYYRKRPPKTAGREQYGAEMVQRLTATNIAGIDLIATATALTAQSIVRGIRLVTPAPVDDVIVSGGGVHNRKLMEALQKLLPEANVASSAAFGIDPDAKEAIAFAVLAYETIHRRPSNLPSATGANRPVILGQITYA